MRMRWVVILTESIQHRETLCPCPGGHSEIEHNNHQVAPVSLSPLPQCGGWHSGWFQLTCWQDKDSWVLLEKVLPYWMHAYSVAYSCLILCDQMDCSSSIHGIFQARILEQGAISFSSHTGWDPGYWNFSTLHATWPHKTPKKETRLPKAVFCFPPNNNVTLGKLAISRSLGFLIYKPNIYVKKLRCNKLKSVF